MVIHVYIASVKPCNSRLQIAIHGLMYKLEKSGAEGEKSKGGQGEWGIASSWEDQFAREFTQTGGPHCQETMRGKPCTYIITLSVSGMKEMIVRSREAGGRGW